MNIPQYTSQRINFYYYIRLKYKNLYSRQLGVIERLIILGTRNYASSSSNSFCDMRQITFIFYTLGFQVNACIMDRCLCPMQHSFQGLTHPSAQLLWLWCDWNPSWTLEGAEGNPDLANLNSITMATSDFQWLIMTQTRQQIPF